MRALSLCTCLPPVPRCSDWASSSLISPSRINLPRNCSRVGLHIDLFGACSALTRVAARTLAPSPIRDLLHRRLQPFCYLHDCSGCFRLERLPGGACTHWKAPPCHGAHVKRPFGTRPWTSQSATPDFRALACWRAHGHEVFIPFGALKRPAHSPSSLWTRPRDILRRWP